MGKARRLVTGEKREKRVGVWGFGKLTRSEDHGSDMPSVTVGRAMLGNRKKIIRRDGGLGLSWPATAKKGERE